MKKILVVDDLTVNISTLQSILNTYIPDFEILTAQSGAEAILLAQNEKPEAILLDYLMPKMNGFEVCKKLKEDENTSNIPVLIVSALGDSSKIRTEGLNAGADAFISKPYDIRELIALVHVMLRIKNAEDSLKNRNEYLELFIKKQTRRYEDSEERFLQISKHALEFFWELNTNGVFIFVSESVESILGYKSHGIIEKFQLSDFADDNNGYKSKQKIKEKIRTYQSFDDDEYAFKHQDGRRVWLTINGFPIFDEENNFQGYRGVCDDNTRRKEAEEQVEKSMTEIKNYQQKLKNLNKELTLTEEKERRRIAEYLHDGIGQTLSLAF